MSGSGLGPGLIWWGWGGGRDLGNLNRGVVAEGGGNGGGEVGGDDEGSLVISRGEVFAEFH